MNGFRGRGPLTDAVPHDLGGRTNVYGEEKVQLDEEQSDSQVGAIDASTDALRDASGTKVRVWVYYNPHALTRLCRRLQVARVRLAISIVRERITTVVVSALAVALVVGLVVFELPSSGALARRPQIATANAQLPPFGSPTAPKTPLLPPASVGPVPAPSSVAGAPPLLPHEVFGFVPYWALGQSDGFAIGGLTTLDYFSVGINPNGTLDESGAGWNGYESQALSTLITRAHGAGARVVLTVNDFDQHSLDELTSSTTAAVTLAKALIGAIEAKSLDGVNLDLEGSGNSDQAGLTRLVTTVSDALHWVNAHWQVTMDTYASSAGDPGGFYDIPALANAIDAFFVMEYSPNVAAPTQATSPLTSTLFSDLTTMEQYAATVPADKVILGTPLFGEDWPTTGNTLSATATGPATAQTDSEIEGTGHPIFWDSITDSAWTAYQVGNQWHEAFFDDPTSLYQIAQLAERYGLRGVGAWALGMQGTTPAMVDALDGSPPAIHYGTPGPPSSTTTTTTTTTPASTVIGALSTTPATTASGGAPASAPDTSGARTDTTAPATPSLVPSFIGTFEAEFLASIEGASPSSPPLWGTPQPVTLCLVTMPAEQSAGCEAPQPPSVGVTTTTGDTTGPTPPFPGAIVAGLLSGIVVNDDAALSCLENDNQSAELGPLTTEPTTPELVVWQSPDDQQYDYVLATTPSSNSQAPACGPATLAFVNPLQTSAAVRTPSSTLPST